MINWSFTYRGIWYSLMLLFGVQSGLSQTAAGLTSYVSWDDCTSLDDQGFLSAEVYGNPECACGVLGSSLKLDGIDDYIDFTGSYQNTFVGNFTIAFYFKPTATSGNLDILSYRLGCALDSVLSVSYVPGSREVVIEIFQNVNRNSLIVANVDPSICWQHLVFTKEDKFLRLYLNGKKEIDLRNSQPIAVTNGGVLSIANSPCLGSTRERFAGYIDELQIYSRSFTGKDVLEIYQRPDDILNQDTTIVSGTSVPIRLSSTCATSFQWNPTTGVAGPQTGETTISPTSSGSYILKMDDGECIVRDTLMITVVNAEDVDCNQIFIPTAFTPNGDGLNDLFRISNAYAIDQLISFDIFSPWGEKMYTATDVFSGWDGSYRGQIQDPGVYVYKLVYRCGTVNKELNGSFSLIR